MSTLASLLDENQRLRAQWKSCDRSRQCAEQQIAEIQSRVQRAEAAAVQQLRQKEAQWMAEYDSGVQALLKIIQHHEYEKAQLQAELERLRSAASVGVPPSITKMTRSTQTDKLCTMNVGPRRNSVRFAQEEDGTASEKEENVCIDAKTIGKIVRMQQLFDQLQAPRDQRSSKLAGEINSCVNNAGPAVKRDSVDRCSVSPMSCDLKAAVLERLEINRPGTERLQSSVATTSSRSKTTETQTDEAPVPKQESPPTAQQQGLEEHNRLLHERLTSQQKVLDHLLYTKLKHASASEEHHLSDHPRSAPTSSQDIVKGCAGKDQDGKQHKFEKLTPTPTLPGHILVAQNDAVNIESTGTTERRPLSPSAA